jgi:uncharacterized protein (TIGR02599 family)
MMMQHHGRQRGFTLIEILVAMTILAIIILIVSGIFHQSSSAWEAGQRKTELNMEGRAAIDLMADELSRAVAGPYTNNIVHGTQVDFWTFGNATNGERVVRHVWYRFQGDAIQRLCQTINPNAGSYPSFIAGADWVTLAENVSSLMFTTPDNASFRTNLPGWVDIDLSLNKKGRYSLIKAWSSGPDGADDGPNNVSDTSDDVRSWKSTL